MVNYTFFDKIKKVLTKYVKRFIISKYTLEIHSICSICGFLTAGVLVNAPTVIVLTADAKALPLYRNDRLVSILSETLS